MSSGGNNTVGCMTVSFVGVDDSRPVIDASQGQQSLSSCSILYLSTPHTRSHTNDCAACLAAHVK